MSRRRLAAAALLAGWTFLLGCGSADPQPPVTVQLLQAESFDWTGQPVSFALPPEGWDRQRSQPGGREGVRFVKSGSVGEVVHVEERFSTANRDRCEKLQALMQDVETMNGREFASAVHAARLYAEPPINDDERWFAEEANLRLNEALTSFRGGDLVGAKASVLQAFQMASRVRYTLDEVVDQAMFKGEGFPPYITAEIAEPLPADVAGEPAIRLDYTLHESGRTYRGRELYVLKNNHLFVVGYQGLEENLPMFEEILTTVSFPDGACRH